MMAARNIKEIIVKVIKEDPQVHEIIYSVVERSEILKEVKLLREDMNKRFETVDRRFEEMREDMNRRFEAIDKRFEAVDKRFEEMLHYMNKMFEAIDKRFEAVDKRFEAVDKRFEELREDLHRSISAIGSRWGIQTEEAFSNAMKGLLCRKFGVDIKKWRYYDKEGYVSGVPRSVEADIKISDSEHILIEVKASVSEGDVGEIKRIGELYQKLTGVEPKLVLVTPFASPRAEELARMHSITIYSHD